MSFKRVADDFDDFNLQRKRRVNDLLLEDVGSDEVHLMANGKLACMVCHYRPVFDTTAMLTIHRNGKKHLANALVKLERAKEDAEIKQKQQHEHYIKYSTDSNSKAPLLGMTNMHKEKALNSSHTSSSIIQNIIAENTQKDNLPNFSTSGNYCISNQTDQTGSSNMTTSHQTISRNSAKGHSRERFFSPKSKLSQSDLGFETSASSSVPIQEKKPGLKKEGSNTNTKSNFQGQQFPNTFQNRGSTSEANSKAQKGRNFFHQKRTTDVAINSSNPNPNCSAKCNTEYNHLGVKRKAMKDRFLSVNPLTQQKAQPEADTTSNDYNAVASSSAVEQPTQRELSEFEKLDQKSKAVYVTKVKQLGWVMGLDGSWQKDENAEFDSDEDEPPSPNTVLQG